LRLRGEIGREQFQLTSNHVQVRHRIATRSARDVHEVHQDLGPFEMTKELVPQALAAVGALDEAGHVCHDEAAVIAQADDAEVRRQCRERVVGNLRACCRDPRDQR